MNLARAFHSTASSSLERTALFWGDQELSYGDILRQSQAVTRLLQTEFHVRPGDRVALWLKNCPEFLPALLGALGAGAVVVPINNFLKPPEVAYIAGDAGARVLIGEAALADGLAQLVRDVPGLRALQVEHFPAPEPAAGSPVALPDRAPSDPAIIIYTSGTTGHPKGAQLSHGNLLHNIESCRQMLEADSGDRFVVLLPMFHSFMMTVGLLLPLTIGGSILLIKSLHPPKAILQEIFARQATILPAIPQFFRALAGTALPPGCPLRLCISGAAPLPLETLREFNERFPIPLIEGYGLSEASPVCSLNPIRGPHKAGSIGIPIPDVEMSVQDEAGNHLGPGETGEICIRGGNVMQGYWNKPEETARALRNGWLLTGDVGHRDADGYFYITDRKKDMLLVNGINVYPREIEEVIYRFPGVREAAVVGVPDPRKGEHPVAFVAANEGATLDEKAIQHHIRQNLADYKVPRKVTVLANLPRNATGKILKTRLRELARSGGDTAR